MSGTSYRPVEGFPGYRVGDDGSVCSCWATCRSGSRLGDHWHRLRGTIGKWGHVFVDLRQGGRRRVVGVHRLVLGAFVSACPAGMECRHLDGDPTNNRLRNLCWGTPVQNGQDRIRHGTQHRGEATPNAKLSDDVVRQIRAGSAAGEQGKAMAARHRISASVVSEILSGKAWGHVL